MDRSFSSPPSRPSRRGFFVASGALVAAVAIGRLRSPAADAAGVAAGHFPVAHTDAEWQRLLTPAQYDVLRHAGTEAPNSSPLETETRVGIFACAACRQRLFASKTKFDSGTGWPSFYEPLPHAVATSSDRSIPLEERTEVHCARCGGHLGHLFDDGPQPTGLRYCMNGVAMVFEAGKASA